MRVSEKRTKQYCSRQDLKRQSHAMKRERERERELESQRESGEDEEKREKSSEERR
jgi:hypothetical protein